MKRSAMRMEFTLNAWTKLLWFRDRGPTEVGGIGVLDPDNLSRITDFVPLKQECSDIETNLDKEDVHRFQLDMMEKELPWDCFSRVWIHTHPGDSAHPSSTDWDAFNGPSMTDPDWSCMLIVSKTGNISCRIRYNIGPGTITEVPVDISGIPAPGSRMDMDEWEDTYKNNIKEKDWYVRFLKHEDVQIDTSKEKWEEELARELEEMGYGQELETEGSSWAGGSS